jgi:hypothetical protein
VAQPLPENVRKISDGEEDDPNRESKWPTDPLIAYGWQRLLNVICAIFAKDWAENNELVMSQNVRCTFSGLKLLGAGTSFVVRKFPDIPAREYAFGSIFSARGTRRTLEVLNGVKKMRSRVCKQIRAVRWRGQGNKSAAILDNVIVELQILNHHPIMMHDNIIDFFGVAWEYDMDRQVWPVLCLEFADHGTLDAFLNQPLVLTFVQKMNLCLDVGNGLRALHECGIIHGDVCRRADLDYMLLDLKLTVKLRSKPRTFLCSPIPS